MFSGVFSGIFLAQLASAQVQGVFCFRRCRWRPSPGARPGAPLLLLCIAIAPDDDPHRSKASRYNLVDLARTPCGLVVAIAKQKALFQAHKRALEVPPLLALLCFLVWLSELRLGFMASSSTTYVL